MKDLRSVSAILSTSTVLCRFRSDSTLRDGCLVRCGLPPSVVAADPFACGAVMDRFAIERHYWRFVVYAR